MQEIVELGFTAVNLLGGPQHALCSAQRSAHAHFVSRAARFTRAPSAPRATPHGGKPLIQRKT